MYYAELITDKIEDRGVFFSVSEFLPYRLAGWTGTEELNALADARLKELAETPDAVVAYMAPMIRTGEDYRTEQMRRRNVEAE